MESDLRNYATKTDLKNVTHVDISGFASKTNLASLKTEVEKLYIIKLTSIPDDLVKPSNVVKNAVVKKTEYDKLVAKADNIDTVRIVLKTTYDTDKSHLEKKIWDADKKIPDLNIRIKEIENKIPSITGLATTSASTAVENKIPDMSGLVTKTTQKYQILKRKLLIIIMIKTLLLQNLIN